MTNRGFGWFGAAVLLLVVIRGALAGSSSTGVLEGRVEILRSGGANLSDDTSARKEKAPYSGSPLVVLSKDGKTEVSQILPDSEGRFHVDLPAGDYVLNLKQHGRGRLRAEARPFTIVAGQTVHVDMTVESAVEAM
jgi:hypothetical protein